MAATAAQRNAAITNKAAAGGAANGGGPHNDSLVDMIGDGFWDGTGTPPQPDYERATATAASPAVATPPTRTAPTARSTSSSPPSCCSTSRLTTDELGAGTYGGLDAVWDDLGATDASVERFVTNNASIVSTTAAGDILIHGVAPDANETHALVSGLTCGRPSNPSTGEDECHAEASYAIVDKGIKENRNHGTGISGNDGTANVATTTPTAPTTPVPRLPASAATTTATPRPVTSPVRSLRFPAAGSYAPIAGCTSCHDQTDTANTVAGNFTFPHGQSATGDTEPDLPMASTTATTGGDVPPNTVVRSRIWSGWAGS